MRAQDTIVHLTDRLGLSPEQAEALFPVLADLVAEALEADGWIGLGELGLIRLGVQAAFEPRGLPERSMAWYRAGNPIIERVVRIPVQVARLVADQQRGRIERRVGEGAQERSWRVDGAGTGRVG